MERNPQDAPALTINLKNKTSKFLLEKNINCLLLCGANNSELTQRERSRDSRPGKNPK